MDFLSGHLALESLNEAGVFTAIASDNTPNRNGFAYAPGAFDASLAEHAARGTMPAMLLHHDMSQPVGNWQEIKPSGGSLRVRGKLAIDTTAGGEAYGLLKAKALAALSTGAIAQEKSRKGDVLVITKADLFEISLVSVPANPNARIIQVNGFESPRDIEEMFRQAGVSGRKAKAMSTAA